MITPRAKPRKDGTTAWIIQYRVAGRGSRTTTRTFDTLAAATYFSKLIDQHGLQIAEQILEANSKSKEINIRFADYATEYLVTLSGIQSDTVDTYRRFIRNDLSFLAHIPINAITSNDIARWVNELEDNGASAKTIKNKHGFISQVFNRAVSDGVIGRNPAQATKLPRSITEEMTILTHTEYQLFLTMFTPFWQPLVQFLFATGVRFGEAAALRILDVDFSSRTLSITRAVKADGTIGAPKSKRSRRTIPIPPEIIKVLKPLTLGRKPTDFLFTGKRGNRISKNFGTDVWNPAVRLANGEPLQDPASKRVTATWLDADGNPIQPLNPPLGKWLTPHDARHTNASWLLAAGVPINVVQAHLGHESITTTVDRYGHIMPESRERITQALSEVLKKIARPTYLV